MDRAEAHGECGGEKCFCFFLAQYKQGKWAKMAACARRVSRVCKKKKKIHGDNNKGIHKTINCNLHKSLVLQHMDPAMGSHRNKTEAVTDVSRGPKGEVRRLGHG